MNIYSVWWFDIKIHMDFESTTLGFTFQCSPSRASGSDVGMYYSSDIEAHRLVYD